MQFSLLTLSAILAAASPIAGQLKVNYYTDGGCSQFRKSFFPVAYGGCINNDNSNSPSMNIANCDGFRACRCDFYVHDNCQGAVATVFYYTNYPNNCASNYPSGFKSMKCFGTK